ncbi:MAG TPA: alkaline phosphatase family protein, partial [Spirochaetia bacterium]|nr:alkaline phosphatase family protein [Spirochaetia bacterium]
MTGKGIRALGRGGLAGLGLAAVIVAGCSFDAASPPPRYDHVVIAIDENKDASQVMGSPFIGSLAAGGVPFAAMYGIVHPSQPNYFALFAGSTMGVTDDVAHDLSGPNLATALSAAGFSFITYSEGLPSAGSRVETD